MSKYQPELLHALHLQVFAVPRYPRSCPCRRVMQRMQSRGPSADGPLESRKTSVLMRFAKQGSTNAGERGSQIFRNDFATEVAIGYHLLKPGSRSTCASLQVMGKAFVGPDEGQGIGCSAS